MNGKRLRVSKARRLDRALLVTGFPYDLKENINATLRFFNRFMSEARAIRRDGSAALNLSYVAAGRFDGFWEEKLGSWDIAAGSLLVSEAGGQVSDLAGGHFCCHDGAVLASNGLLHDSMLEVLADSNLE
jgi:myo-inositol-1(or 4)-monophosphatase